MLMTSRALSPSDNLLHCAPHPETSHAVFKHASQLIRRTSSKQGEAEAGFEGWVSVYGAFKRDDGEFASEGDKKVSVLTSIIPAVIAELWAIAIRLIV
jgi:hypothetical protein